MENQSGFLVILGTLLIIWGDVLANVCWLLMDITHFSVVLVSCSVAFQSVS